MTVKRDPRANLHRGHSQKTAESRARSLAGLTAGNTTHGAHNASATAPAAARERRRLRKRYPAAAGTVEGADLITTMGLRCSAIGRYTTYLDEHPGRRPDAPAARELRLLLAAQERALRRLADLERQATTEDPGAALRAVMSEYANAELGEATVIDGDDQR